MTTKEFNILAELQRQIRAIERLDMFPIMPSDNQRQERRWADLTVGDFEIRVINREKLGLDPQ